MPEQKLTWEQIPEDIKKLAISFLPIYDGFTDRDKKFVYEQRADIANKIMEAMKPEQEKAWTGRTETRYKDDGDSYESIVIYDFENWYQNAYLK